jgi:DNA end-binding protein Ku
MRAIWKGHISFSLVVIPIRIYSAVEPSESISFNQLHKEDFGRIGYDKKCKKCNQGVAGTDIVKGFEYTKDKYILIEPEDLDKIKLTSTKIIQIEGFLDSGDVEPVLYDTPYFIGPDGEIAAKAYNLLMQTMRETNKIGIGRVVIRDREDVVLISPLEKGLVLYKIRYPNEVRNIEEVPQLKEIKVAKSELNLAKSLVDTMTVKMGDIEVKDRYKEALKELIQSKLEGTEIADTEEQKVTPVIDLMAALKESLNKTKESKKLPMQKAKGKKKSAAAPKRKQA